MKSDITKRGASATEICTVAFEEKKVDAIFANLDQCQLPGAAVGIAIGGRPVYRKGFGLANMELPIVLSPTVRMRIASTSKHFACFAYMLLCEEGRSGLDDPVGRHLPELHPVTHKITMSQLMGNTSGLRDVCDVRMQFSGTQKQVPSAELLSLYQDIDDVNVAPGQEWIYNSGGFLILTAVIERITRQPLEKVLRDRVFDPVGMHNTLLRRFDTDFLNNSAALHMVNSSGSYEKWCLGGALAGEGGIVSTVDDMLRWLAHMARPTIGSAATWAAMKTSQILANGTSTGYGLGLMIGDYRGVETLNHWGSWTGGSAQMLKVPNADLDVVVLTNRYDAWAMLLTERVLDACLPFLDPIREAIHSRASGTLRSPTTGRVIQLVASSTFPWNRGANQFVSIDGLDMPLEYDEDRKLWCVRTFGFAKQTLALMGNADEPASIRLTGFGNVDEFFTIPAADELTGGAEMVGTYRSRSTCTEATITECGGGVRLCTVGKFGSAEFSLECLAKHTWRARSIGAMPWGGILSFDAHGSGFHYSNFFNRSLFFERHRDLRVSETRPQWWHS